MLLCRYLHKRAAEVGLYLEDRVVGINRAAELLKVRVPTPDSADILDYLAPHGRSARAAAQVAAKLGKLTPAEQRRVSVTLDKAQVLAPVPNPSKVILLAGNYAAHIQEGGGQAVERAETFPYFFWKPPGTTLTHPGDPIRIPKVSPNRIDWEIELGAIIGKRARHVSEQDALGHVAGYTVCVDVSDRGMRLNPGRKPRDKDSFFDWLHGKWHDTFLPMGPCVRTAASLPDPQDLRLALKVNGQTMQDASTALMIFPVAALVSIVSSLVTLEPGDIIVTGTPQGVGHARKPPIYLKPGDMVEAAIAGIGVLTNPVVAEKP